MILNLGDYPTGATVYVPFHTFDSNDPSASVTTTGLAVTDIEIYKDGSVTQRSSDSGYSLLDTDGIDFDGITGLHGFSIDLSDNTDAGFFAAGSQYWIAVSSITVDAATINFWAGIFTIARTGGVATILTDTEAVLADSEAIITDSEAILADTEAAATSLSTVITDTEALLVDTEASQTSETAILADTEAAITARAALLTDTEALLVDTEASQVAETAILADTEAAITARATLLTDTEAVLADTEAAATSLTTVITDTEAVLADTEASQTAETSILADTEAVLTDSEAILADTGALSFKKNTAVANFMFHMVDETDLVTPETGLTVTAQRSIDGAAFAACANSVTEVSNGWYKINLATTDMNGDDIALRFTATGAAASNFYIKTQNV